MQGSAPETFPEVTINISLLFLFLLHFLSTNHTTLASRFSYSTDIQVFKWASNLTSRYYYSSSFFRTSPTLPDRAPPVSASITLNSSSTTLPTLRMVRRNRGRGRQGGNGPRAANNTNTPAPAPTPDANQSLSTSEDWGSFEASINNLNVGQYSGNNRAGAATRPAAPVGQAAVPRPAAPVRQAPAPRPAAPRPAAPVRQVAAPRPSPSPPAGVNSAWATPSPSASSNSAWTTPRPSYSNAAASRQPTVSSTPGSSWASVVGSNSRQSRTSQSPVVSSSTPASSEWTPTDAPPTGPRPLTSLASSEAGWDQAHLYSMPGRARTGVNQNAVQPVPGFTPKDPENSVKSRRDGNLLPWDLDPTFVSYLDTFFSN